MTDFVKNSIRKNIAQDICTAKRFMSCDPEYSKKHFARAAGGVDAGLFCGVISIEQFKSLRKTLDRRY